MRRLAPRPLAHALADITGTLAPATTLARVQARWREIVGEQLAGEARPVSERGGEVTVSCRSAVWAQELALMASDLLERINAALVDEGRAGAVTALRFRGGTPG